ncbi:MAG: hypothetical protein IM607_09230 [Cytophagales bacterium]|jgi:ABC-type iron transport system FetAB permease component|nr:hypothetical protein [Cytophagales bacterium]MCA6416374.1 hypothetical protein [Cytophagales bacterium]
MFENVSEEIKSWIVKPLIWAMMAVSVKLAVQSKKEKLTVSIVITSFLAGIGSAWIFADYVILNYSHQYQPMIIAVIAISGEKIVEYVLYKINFQEALDALIKIFHSK